MPTSVNTQALQNHTSNIHVRVTLTCCSPLQLTPSTPRGISAKRPAATYTLNTHQPDHDLHLYIFALQAIASTSSLHHDLAPSSCTVPACNLSITSHQLSMRLSCSHKPLFLKGWISACTPLRGGVELQQCVACCSYPS